MFTDLFSSLDSNQYNLLSFVVWGLPVMLSVTFMFSGSWFISPASLMSSLLTVTSDSGNKKVLAIPMFLFSLMFFLAQMNLLGLTPLTYGGTSSLWTASSLAVTLWFALILSGWVKFPKEAAAHLAPAGAPSALIPFLVLIETVSMLIRPLTLTVRLIANISAGHIVLGLLSNCLSSSSLLVGGLLLSINVFYNMFELFVCFIQAYIFSLLLKLYSEEHP